MLLRAFLHGCIYVICIKADVEISSQNWLEIFCNDLFQALFFIFSFDLYLSIMQVPF